jgi:GT2 family glycosyltransferase/glycosyltransferase involved in cell wall biosynthesis
MKTCIVTSDLVGPIKNGGIGTHCYYLARFLREELGHEVTVLFTSSISEAALRPWKKRYSKEWGIGLVGLKSTVSWPQIKQSPSYPVLRRSRQVYDWLKEQDFDYCHFEDWQPEGFLAIQAKRTGQAFDKTKLIFGLHGNAEWSREGMLAYEDNWTLGLANEYMARYSAEHADLLLSPSQHMFDWAQAHRWTLAANRRVIPYLFELPFPPQPKPFARQHLIFFGRLETRKGLIVFVKALQALAPQLTDRPEPIRVTFLGRNYYIGKQLATDYLAEAMKPCGKAFDWQVVSDLGQPEALRFVTDHANALVVLPSLVDNLPFTVIECLQLRLNLIASRVGGIPELIDTPECLFDPTPQALSQKLLECLRDGVPAARSRYNADDACAGWRKVHEPDAYPARPTREIRAPRVSVCVPHHNYGEFLPLALDTLASQTYKNFEVIVVDDGSTDPESLKTFRSLQQKYSQLEWRFLEKENGFTGQTRNFAARQATGEYLVFADSDNVSRPEMLDRLVQGMETSGMDCLACHNLAFSNDISRQLGQWRHRYVPLGPCLELAMYHNTLGDVNFIIRREVFEKLGGFHEERIGLEDWDFLLRLVMNGFTLDVIPEVLFYYRQSHTSVTGVVNHYTSHQRLLRNVTSQMPLWQQRFLTNAVGAFWTNLTIPRAADVELDADIPVLPDDAESLRGELARLHARLETLKKSPLYAIGRWWYYLTLRFKKKPPTH